MLGLYAVTLFVSAMLMFIAEPMIGKMILPTFGGTPAVWNTCMVFFQATLLAGYAYAHGGRTWLGTRAQAVIHLGLLATAVVVLPINLAGLHPASAESNPAFWLLGQLVLGVGIPFFIISSTAPLLQSWFASTEHPAAKDPYFLYGASNIGSLLGLLGYPLIIERKLHLSDQSRVWTLGYGLLILLTAACAAAMWRSARRGSSSQAVPELPSDVRAAGSANASRFWWIVLSAIPSSLMLGTTTHLTTNIAAVPLLWVAPLGLYLLTFILVFARKPIIQHARMVRLLPYLALTVGPLAFAHLRSLDFLSVPLHLSLFFVVAMVCHGELVRHRPEPRRLTEFYLLMSVGGILGGLFNSLLAPWIFSTVLEYPLAICLACLVAPPAAGRSRHSRDRLLDLIIPAVLAALAAVMIMVIRLAWSKPSVEPLAVFGVLALVCFAFKDRPVRFGLSFAVAMAVLSVLVTSQAGTLLHVDRNFFGVKKVVLNPAASLRLFVHGTTCHGSQRTDPARADEPLAYYHRSGPLGDVFEVLNQSGRAERVGIIGLGTGTVASYARAGQEFTFYEIDPAIERIARDRRYFSFLADSPGRCTVVLGDGRLTIAQPPDRWFDLILLDAFSSEAIPTHLLAQEAVELYLSKLKPDGLLVFHVSNNFFDFEPLLANLAAACRLACLSRQDLQVSPKQQADGKLPSCYVVMTREGTRCSSLASRPAWHQPVGRCDVAVWSDDHSDLLSLLKTGSFQLGPRQAAAATR